LNQENRLQRSRCLSNSDRRIESYRFEGSQNNTNNNLAMIAASVAVHFQGVILGASVNCRSRVSTSAM
jgi:hypothetical protein